MATGDLKGNKAVDLAPTDEKLTSIHQTASLHSSEADVGYDLFSQTERLTHDEKNGGYNREKEWEEDSRFVLKQVDRHVLPIMCMIASSEQSELRYSSFPRCIVYCLQSMDSTSPLHVITTM